MPDLVERLQTALADRYRIERELGRGGMATVFLAEDLRHERPVAFKVLHPDLAATLGPDRFLREIRIAARLQHPHILSVHDSGETAGCLWFTMPYVDGESLRERLAREHQLPVKDALRLTREIATALDFAHRHGVIHRDIKPENILLVDGQALVADFGIGRALGDSASDERLTQTGVVLGTPTYMSPEQATGERELDARTDVYSLGTVLFEMLGGEPPFTGSTAQAIMAKRLTGEVPSLRRLRPAVPEWLEQVVRKALATMPADRFATPAQLAQALAPALATAVGPSAAPEPAGSPRLGTGTEAAAAAARPGRRRLSAPALPVFVVAGLVIAGLGMLLWQRSRHPDAPSGARMLAVLPFKNLGAPGDEYFADGLTEEITSRLAGVSDLGVISRTSADQYKNTPKTIKQIGQELGVGYVLEGSVRWERSSDGSSRVRVTPQLIRVSDDRHLWAERYDAVIAEVFQVQSSIAQQVIAAMDLALDEPERRALDDRPTTSLEAYDFYLRGNDYYSRGYAGEDLRSAIQMYQRAIELDSTFAQAYAKLSESHSALFWFFHDRTEAALERAKAAADKALLVRPELPHGHIALGYYYYWGRLDYARALEEFDLGRKSQPNKGDLVFAVAAVQRRQGRWAEALANFNKAAELDPRAGIVRFNLGETYTLVRDYDRALQEIDAAIELIPDWPLPYLWKAGMLLASGADVEDARQVLRLASQKMSFTKLAAAMSGAVGFNLFAGAPVSVLITDPAHGAALRSLSLAVLKDTVAYYHLMADLHREERSTVALAYLDSARAALEGQVRAHPEEASFHARLGLIYAYLGRRADATREGQAAARLLPVSKEAYRGANLLATLALIYTTVGRHSEATDQLEYLLSVPSLITQALLRADSRWAPLRADARFQRLVTRHEP